MLNSIYHSTVLRDRFPRGICVSSKRYLNFDLAIERAANAYRAHVLNSPAGQAVNPMVLSFASGDLTPLFAGFGRTSPGTPADPKVSSAHAQDFGRQLFGSVFAGDVKSLYANSMQTAASQGAGLRISLRLNDVPELADLPWELLHDGEDFVLLSTQRTLVRFLELPRPLSPLAVKPPLRILTIISNPSDYEPLDLEAEWQHLNEALAESTNPGFFELDLLPRASLSDLQVRLRQGEYHILHFSGHGTFNPQAEDASKGMLVFQWEDGKGTSIDALTIGRLLVDHPSLRLVVLNACEGARASTRNAFAGVAQSLIRLGIPAVVAMQFPISDEAAQTFATTLYGTLGDGFPIDAAVSETRKALALHPSYLEWVTPVLFTRTADGQLFDISAVDEAGRRQLNGARLTQLGTAALENEDLERAQTYASRLLELDPSKPDGKALLDRVERERNLSRLYAEGKTFVERGSWPEALERFQQIQWLKVNYRDVPALLANAKRALQTAGTAGAAAVSTAPDPIDPYYKSILKELFKGRLVPFLGMRVNLYGRSPEEAWLPGQAAPSAEELAGYLARTFDYDQADANDLLRVTEYISVMHTPAELYEELHALLEDGHTPTPLHRFCAEIPALLRDHGKAGLYPILVTANYDDLLEQALREEGEPFDQLTYLAEGEDRGRFLHSTFEGKETVVKNPSSYADMQLDRRTTLIKVHGAVRRAAPDRDSFVITEDHYLDYLQASITSLLPRDVAARLKEASILFLGCNLRNWSLRGLLRNLANPNRRPWVVHPQATEVDKQFWRKLDVYVLDLPLEDFVSELAARAQEPEAGGMA